MPALSSLPTIPSVATLGRHVQTCAKSAVQPAWIFAGACQVGKIGRKGTKIALGAYDGMTLSGTIGRTNLRKPAPFVVVDATGKGDVQPYKKTPFPVYAEKGRKALLYVQTVNAGKSSILLRGKPALALTLDVSRKIGSNCNLALLTQNSPKQFAWLDLLFPVKQKGTTLSVQVASLPAPLPAGPAYFAFTCATTSPTASPSPTPSPSTTYYPTNGGLIQSLTNGPDGNFWFVDSNNDKIGKMTPSGSVTWYALPLSGGPYDIAAGPDGNLWFTWDWGNPYQTGDSFVGSITTDGTVTTYPITAAYGKCQPALAGITAGPDGNIWFTDDACGNVGKLDLSTKTITLTPTLLYGTEITTGPDGNLWYGGYENGGPNAVAKMTTSGSATIYPVATGLYINGLNGIVTGPDKNIWFTYYSGSGYSHQSGVGRITTGGTIATFGSGIDVGCVYLCPASSPLTVGPDKNLWFTSDEGLVSVTTAGTVTSHSIPLANNYTAFDFTGLVLGPDKNLWFSDGYSHAIGRYSF